MDIQLYSIPYDSGYKDTRMGKGPEYLMKNGLFKLLLSKGYSTTIEKIETNLAVKSELENAFAIFRTLSEKVWTNSSKTNFPVVLSGNCNTVVGAISGLDEDVGVIWFDAHGDCKTPETTSIAFLDGMGIPMIMGLCWKNLLSQVPHYQPIPISAILHLGGRHFYKEEKEFISKTGLNVIPADVLLGNSEAMITNALKKVTAKKVYLHIDLDVLDPTISPANEYAVCGGIGQGKMLDILDMVGETHTIVGCGFASYDPEYDNGQLSEVAIALCEKIVDLANSDL